MIELPETEGVPVLRTDFTDDAKWAQLWDALTAEDYNSGYPPNLSAVERRDLNGVAADEVEAQVSRTYPSIYQHPFLIVVDAVTMTSEERPVLLIGLNERDTSASFRAIPREVAAIEANLSLANLDFADFVENADDDGIYRGFE